MEFISHSLMKLIFNIEIEGFTVSESFQTFVQRVDVQPLQYLIIFPSYHA